MAGGTTLSSKDATTCVVKVSSSIVAVITIGSSSVSVTVTFKPDEAPQIKDALEMYETRLKAVSFLKYEETGYEQAPYEPITKEQYETLSAKITPVTRFDEVSGTGTKFCDGESCIL